MHSISILFTLIVLALVTLTTAFPTGSGTCFSNQTIIEGVPNQPMGKLNELGYSFAVDMKYNYVPGGDPVNFCVHGKAPFKGLLAYALDVNRNRVGSWIITPGTPYKILNLNCTGDPKGTITHSDPTEKGPDVCFQWVPPTKDVGPINFVGTVVQGKVKGFQIIRVPTVFVVKDSKFVTTTIATTPNKYEPTMTMSNGYPDIPTFDGGFNPPIYNAANGLTYSKHILLLQIIVISSIIFYLR